MSETRFRQAWTHALTVLGGMICASLLHATPLLRPELNSTTHGGSRHEATMPRMFPDPNLKQNLAGSTGAIAPLRLYLPSTDLNHRSTAVPTLIDSNAVLTTNVPTGFASGSLAGGSLAVSVALAANPAACDPDDQLTIENQRTGEQRVALIGTRVSFEDVVIGTRLSTFSCAAGRHDLAATPLLIEFNSAATTTAVQAVIRALQFYANPTDTRDRIATVIVRDRAGAYVMASTAADGIFRSGFEPRSVQSNSNPDANPQAVSADEDMSQVIMLTGSDFDGDSLNFAISTGTAHGSLSAITQVAPTSAQLTYTPDTNFAGTDSFSFMVNDGLVDSAAAIVSINVNPRNDVPQANTQSIGTSENTPILITLTGSDIDNANVTFAIGNNPSHGLLSAITQLTATSAQVTYTPYSGYFGADHFTFTTNDTQLDSLPATVSIQVNPQCQPLPELVVRDFQVSHPDFEDFAGFDPGIVEFNLGLDRNPVYTGNPTTPTTSGAANFNQWYNDSIGVNQSFAVPISLTEVAPGIFEYASNAFFPIDHQGWGNEGNTHNYHFTSELHTSFLYRGGETFTFEGKDDAWVFINGKRRIDLGGVHGSMASTITLDTLDGLQIGQVYALDLFHANRHTTESNFKIRTTISCFRP